MADVAKKVSKPKKAPAHAPFRTLVLEAVAALKEVRADNGVAQQHRLQGPPQPLPGIGKGSLYPCYPFGCSHCVIHAFGEA